MSSLLERAIVDATALKEAALKNAENLVIEKYSEEVRSAMNTLLEAPGDDPFADLGAEEDILDTPIDTGETEGDATAQEFADSTIGNIPDAFDPDMGDPEDEIINIKLDSLRAELPEEEEGPFASGEEFDDADIGIDITDEDEIADPEIDLDLDTDIEADITPDADIGVDITPEMYS